MPAAVLPRKGKEDGYEISCKEVGGIGEIQRLRSAVFGGDGGSVRRSAYHRAGVQTDLVLFNVGDQIAA